MKVSLAHNGHSTLDTGLLGKVYWQRTGPGGFGMVLRSTSPPLADGTLASYVSPAFVRANTQFIDDPDQVAAVYGAELRHQVVITTLELSIVGGAIGGTLLVLAWTVLGKHSSRRRWVVFTAVVATGGVALGVAAAADFRSWEGNRPVGATFPLAGHSGLSFSSPQTREIAEQVQPFIEKNTDRIKERAATYESTAALSLRSQLAARSEVLQPRSGEKIILAEADPQGSLVGTRVRRDLYRALLDDLPDGAVILRTIAGDITSNGTVAEADFTAGEASATPPVPVVAAKGDHDTDVTVDQLIDGDVTVPDTEVVDVGGLSVASARDPAFKALFGGLVVNDTGVTEADIGASLRERVDDAVSNGTAAVDVVLHQPRAVQGYLGVDLDDVRDGTSSLTTPVDDGVPDLPPGIITYGHLHDPAGPWVVWNTDSDTTTWTVITQLGTAGGVEERPTFNRFSTPFSTPLKALSVQLQYLNPDTGLQTGLVPITFAPDGTASIGDRIDVGLLSENPDGAP